jgi:phosphoribosyl 1,2-cyclic phosphodiesterase
MMRFCSLGSGSGGNATLIEVRSGTTTSRVLVDCGFSLRELEARLARIGLQAPDLDAVFVTHEHGDHIGCAVMLARRHKVALWTSRGTWRAIGEPELPGLLHFARDGEAIDIGDLRLLPYTVPHDASEPLQPCFTDGASKLGILTDAGMSTPYLLARLQQCDALLLECNHDRELLARSRYPASVKARIGGNLGHLSNHVATEILSACMHGGLRHVVAAHLSEQNNLPGLAATALALATGGRPEDIVIADPTAGFGWLPLR